MDQVCRTLLTLGGTVAALAALKGATHSSQFDALVATLRFAQRYTARVDFSDRSTAERDLAETFALRDPTEAEERGIRLRLPTSA